MKKIANYLIALAVAAFTFTSCEDVPSPFGTVVQPDSGDEVVIEPTGNGTEADPYNVAAVLEYISGLGVGVQSDKEFYVKGIISEVKEVQTTGTYGNATYWISDDADGKANKFYIYRGYGLGGKKFTEGATPVQAGDNVVIKSKVMNYNGTYETVQNNCIIVELNGTKDSGGGGDTPTSDLGTKDAPITVAKALETINKLADGGETGEAYVKGTISKVQSYNSQYKSITYYISDDGKETNELQVYSGKGLNGADFAAKEDLAAGDVVVIKGKLKKFVKNETITPEINQSSEIISLTKGSGGGTPTSDLGTKDAPITVAKALETINSLADGGETEEAYVKGTISKVQSYNSQYKSITYYISDDGKETNELQVYSGKGLNGADFAAKEDLAAGDVVLIKGKLKKYVKNGTVTPEINQSSEIITITKGSGGGTPTSDLGTKDAPITVAKALETINSLADGGETGEAYVKGIISKVQSYNSQYKSITYYISDDGKEANELQVYSGKGLNGAEFAAKEDLAAGDVVVIKGKLKKYVKNGTVTPEINQSSEIISINKGSGGGGGGSETSGNEITAAFSDLNCSDLNAINLSDGTTIAVTQEDGKSTPIYHESTKIIRIYARNAMTIDAGSKKIAKLVLSYDTYQGTAYKGNDELYGEVGSSKITPSKDDATVTFSNVNGNKIKVVNWLESGNSGGVQLRLTKITITYAK